MSTMTFQINDAGSTDSTSPSVWVSISEANDGTLSFRITQEGGIIGDLRGVFFDIADESLLSTLQITANSSDIRIGDDLIRDLGDGANMNGLTGADKGYDVGIEIGTAGIGKDDIHGYTFTLGSTARDLTLTDFSQVDFGVRLTSVGILSGKRVDSSKLLENTAIALQLANTDAQLNENTIINGNVLSGLQLLGSTQITGWSGNTIGSQLVLTSENDTVGVVTLNYDGSFTIDTSMADKLSVNESIIFDLAYSARNQDEATSWSTDTASFSIAINGENDEPVANNDEIASNENASFISGNVLLNDNDIDRLDTIQVASWGGGALGESISINNGAGASFKLNADGSYQLDSSGADALSEGEVITQSFTYTLSDNHNATDTATITVKVTGQNDAPNADDDNAGVVSENSGQNGNVLTNDSDIDRLDTLSVSAINNTAIEPGESLSIELASGAIVTMFTDGSYHYDTNGAFSRLSLNETDYDSFTYTVSDGHGGFDTATVNFEIKGESNDTPEIDTPIVDYPPPPPPVDMFPAMLQDISNVVLYMDDGNSATEIIKIKLQPEGLNIKDVDDLKIPDFIQGHTDLLDGNNQLVGISIHAGQEYPNLAGTDMTAQGEGPFFFLLDGEASAAEAIGTHSDHGWTMNWENDDIPLTAEAIAIGLNNDLLASQASIVFTQFNTGIWSM